MKLMGCPKVSVRHYLCESWPSAYANKQQNKYAIYDASRMTLEVSRSQHRWCSQLFRCLFTVHIVATNIGDFFKLCVLSMFATCEKLLAIVTVLIWGTTWSISRIHYSDMTTAKFNTTYYDVNSQVSSKTLSCKIEQEQDLRNFFHVVRQNVSNFAR